MAVTAALVSAFGLRLMFLNRYNAVANLDEANIGVMAIDILRGKIPIFMYGHNYFGPLEAFFEAAGLLFLDPSPALLRLIIIVISLLTIVALWLGSRLLLNNVGVLTAITWYSLPPVILTIWTILPNGAHISGMLTGAVLFYLLARLIVDEVHTKRFYLFTGLVIGFSLWNHPGNLLHVVAALFVVLMARPKALLGLLIPISVVGIIIGGFPFWWYTVKSNLSTLEFGQNIGMGRSAVELAWDMWTTIKTAPLFLGFDLAAEPISTILTLIMVVLLLYSIWLTILGVIKHERGSYASLFGWLLIVESIVAYTLIDGSRHGWVQFRYFLPTIFSLALVLGYTFQHIYAIRKELAIGIFGVIVIANTIITIHSYNSHSYDVYKMDTRLDDRFFLHHELLPVFNKLGITHSFVRFHDDAPIIYLTGGKVIASAYSDSRLWEYSLKTLAADHPSFTVEKHLTRFFNNALKSIGARFKITTLNHYDIYHDITSGIGGFTPLDKSRISATASPSEVNIGSAFDGDFDTLWNSQRPQDGNEWILIDLGDSRNISRIDIVPTSVTDMPAQTVIETSTTGKRWEKVVDSSSLGSFYWSGPHPVFQGWDGFHQYIFAPRKARYIKILQKAKTRWHWHVREIEIYTSRGNIQYPKVDWDRVMEILREHGIKRVLSDYYFSSNVILRSNNQIWANTRKNTLNPDERSVTEFDKTLVSSIAVHKDNDANMVRFLKDQGLAFKKEDLDAYVLYFNIKDNTDNVVTIFGSECREIGNSTIECDLGKRLLFDRFRILETKSTNNVNGVVGVLYKEDGEWKETRKLNKIFDRFKWTGSYIIGMEFTGEYKVSPVKTETIRLKLSKQ